MNAIKSLLQNVVNVKTHSAESTQSTTNNSLFVANANVDNVNDENKVPENPKENHPSDVQLKHIRLIANNDAECINLQETIFDLIRGIIDPEKPQTLEELDVVKEEDVLVYRHEDALWINLEFTPTVPHCSLASLIGLCLRSKLESSLPDKHKLDIYIKEGTHTTADEINKQINDKERIAAAMENPNLRELVDRCISQE